jgi:hypothetical protein
MNKEREKEIHTKTEKRKIELEQSKTGFYVFKRNEEESKQN